MMTTVSNTLRLSSIEVIVPSFVDNAYREGRALLSRRSDRSRKQQGQFLTSPLIAQHMAKQLGPLPEDARILDPSIGSAVLPCAVIEHAIATGFPKRLQIIGYDTDAELCETARTMLAKAATAALQQGITVSFEVKHKDFLSAHFPVAPSPLFDGPEEVWGSFDAAIANPPYFKLRANDPRVQAITGRVRGHSNIYTLFMALSAQLLESQGKSVFIVPRSFCSGAYFAGFRDDFIKQVKPSQVHVFESRQEAFKSDAVLQENVIIAFKKLAKGDAWHNVQITSSSGAGILNASISRKVDTGHFLARRNGAIFFRIPTSELDEHILDVVDSWPDSLHSHGLEVSTGPVVPFRARHLLADVSKVEDGTALPLYWMQNIEAGRSIWPAERGKKSQGILKEASRQKLLVPAANYVLIRRFSAKEERRRLNAAPFLKADYGYELVGLENHVNFSYRKNGDLTEDEARGLAALLNSALIDRYFRILNGHTQVNATDLRTLPLPSLEVIAEIGQRMKTAAPQMRDSVVFTVLQHHEKIPVDFPNITETRIGMGKIQEAQDLLKTLGLPKAQQNEMAALTLLVLAQLSEGDAWSQAVRKSLKIHDMMREMASRYDRNYAENTRETVRRHVIHQFEQAGIVERNPDGPTLPTNSPRTHYALSEATLKTIRSYNSEGWIDAATWFLENQRSLIERYQTQRDSHLVPLKLPTGEEYHLSPGIHNELQVAIIEKFGPRFAPGARPLYVGDTANKTLHIDERGFAEIGMPIPSHDKLPDVVLYDPDKDWIYLIEAVISHGPVSPKRLVEMRELLLKDTEAEPVFVTAFPDFKTFKDYLLEIAWETEVWIAEQPAHMVHFNGDRFLGPH
jgi:adenine-specific DNA-methyltransferase